MPDPDTTAGGDETGQGVETAGAEAIRSVESYEADDGVVFYDSDNPLAWLQSDDVVDLDDAA